MPESAGRGRQIDPEILKVAQTVQSGNVAICTGDENLTGQKRQTSARSEAARVYNALVKLGYKGRVQQVWVPGEQAVYVGLKGTETKAPKAA